MKKTIFTLAVVALLAGVCSCTKEKEGVYNPKQKIQSVYFESKGVQGDEVLYENTKYKSEAWTWEDNRLDRISYFEPVAYYTDGNEHIEIELVYTQLFSYDKDNRLTKSEILGEDNMAADYTYEGNYLKTVSITEQLRPMVKYSFNYTDKKITSIDMTVYQEEFKKGASDNKVAKVLMRTNPLRFVMTPEAAARTMSATQRYAKLMAKKGCTKGSSTVTLKVEWDGDNISKISGTAMGESMALTYKHDNKNNPYYGLFDIMSLASDEVFLFLPMSRHNITEATQTFIEDGEEESYTISYTYTYNGKDYPTSKTLDEVEQRYDWTYNEETGEYEYVELGEYHDIQTIYYEY